MTFYERVKQEYLSSYEVFLCDGSETFRNNWLSFPIIKVHAEKFLIEKNLNDLLIGGCILFIVRDYLTTKLSPKQIRLDFLNWCIDNGLRLCDVPHSRMLKISTKVHSGILQNRCYGLAFNDNALDGLCKIHNK